MTAAVSHRTRADSAELQDVRARSQTGTHPAVRKIFDGSRNRRRLSSDFRSMCTCAPIAAMYNISMSSIFGAMGFHIHIFRAMRRECPTTSRRSPERSAEHTSPPTGSLVIDIGSNDGSLLKPFKQAGHRVLGIDPAKSVARRAVEAGIPTIAELMTPDLARKIREQHGPAHVVCAFNVFAHADDLSAMAESIRTMLAPDGLFFFEAQYLLDIVDGMLIATIFHEHMSYHS